MDGAWWASTPTLQDPDVFGGDVVHDIKPAIGPATVVARAADGGIGLVVPADHQVVAGSAQHGIVAAVAVERVGAVAAAERIVAGASEELVGPAHAIEIV